MAISLDTGIEGISYQSREVGLKSDFPQRKEYLPTNATILSHLGEVFNLHAHAQMLENIVAPKVPNRSVVSPSGYSRLFEEVGAIADNHMPRNDHERQVVQAAKALLDAMKEDFQAFNTGRSALIQG